MRALGRRPRASYRAMPSSETPNRRERVDRHICPSTQQHGDTETASVGTNCDENMIGTASPEYKRRCQEMILWLPTFWRTRRETGGRLAGHEHRPRSPLCVPGDGAAVIRDLDGRGSCREFQAPGSRTERAYVCPPTAGGRPRLGGRGGNADQGCAARRQTSIANNVIHENRPSAPEPRTTPCARGLRSCPTGGHALLQRRMGRRQHDGRGHLLEQRPDLGQERLPARIGIRCRAYGRARVQIGISPDVADLVGLPGFRLKQRRDLGMLFGLLWMLCSSYLVFCL